MPRGPETRDEIAGLLREIELDSLRAALQTIPPSDPDYATASCALAQLREFRAAPLDHAATLRQMLGALGITIPNWLRGGSS